MEDVKDVNLHSFGTQIEQSVNHVRMELTIYPHKPDVANVHLINHYGMESTVLIVLLTQNLIQKKISVITVQKDSRETIIVTHVCLHYDPSHTQNTSFSNFDHLFLLG